MEKKKEGKPGEARAAMRRPLREYEYEPDYNKSFVFYFFNRFNIVTWRDDREAYWSEYVFWNDCRPTLWQSRREYVYAPRVE